MNSTNRNLSVFTFPAAIIEQQNDFMDRLLKFGGIAFVLYLLFQKAGTYISNQISVGRPRIKLGKLSVNGAQATLTIPVTNNLPVSAPIQSLQGQVVYGTFPLASFALQGQVVVGANKTTELVFDSFINWAQLSGNIIDMVESGQFLNSLIVKGFVTSEGVVFPFENKVL